MDTGQDTEEAEFPKFLVEELSPGMQLVEHVRWRRAVDNRWGINLLLIAIGYS